METNMFRVLQYLWGAGKLKIPYACRSSLRSTMKKFKSRQKRNTRNSSLMPRPWKCWNLRYCLQCCGFDPPGNTCLQPQRFVFPFRKSSASHCLRSCLSYLVCWSQLTLLKLQPRLLQQGKLPGWSNTRSKTVKLQLISKKETWGKKINQKKKKNNKMSRKREVGKVQSNSVALQRKRAEIITFSTEKMKVIKKEFFLQSTITGDYSVICRR